MEVQQISNPSGMEAQQISNPSRIEAQQISNSSQTVKTQQISNPSGVETQQISNSSETVKMQQISNSSVPTYVQPHPLPLYRPTYSSQLYKVSTNLAKSVLKVYSFCCSSSHILSHTHNRCLYSINFSIYCCIHISVYYYSHNCNECFQTNFRQDK